MIYRFRNEEENMKCETRQTRRIYSLLASACTLSILSICLVLALAGDTGAADRVDWRLEKTTGDKPSARGGGKWVAIGNKLVMFGGFRECFDKNKCDHTQQSDICTTSYASLFFLTQLNWRRNTQNQPRNFFSNLSSYAHGQNWVLVEQLVTHGKSSFSNIFVVHT